MGLLRFDLFEVRVAAFFSQRLRKKTGVLFCFCQNNNVKSKSES